MTIEERIRRIIYRGNFPLWWDVDYFKEKFGDEVEEMIRKKEGGNEFGLRYYYPKSKEELGRIDEIQRNA